MGYLEGEKEEVFFFFFQNQTPRGSPQKDDRKHGMRKDYTSNWYVLSLVNMVNKIDHAKIGQDGKKKGRGKNMKPEKLRQQKW